ncbi:hypothetical protein LY76DRAFT_267303 [Colletotrichum caudatum]|nr:hypothetical protein LY76DRAFT_267303 [Colletotrichum caudatum]
MSLSSNITRPWTRQAGKPGCMKQAETLMFPVSSLHSRRAAFRECLRSCRARRTSPPLLSKKGAAEGFEKSQRKPRPVRLGSEGREACFLGTGRHGVGYHSPLHGHTWGCVRSTRSGEKSTWSITGLRPDDLVWPRLSFTAKEIFIFLERSWRSWKFSPMGSLRGWDPSLRASGRRGGKVRWLVAERRLTRRKKASRTAG